TTPTLLPYTTLFRSVPQHSQEGRQEHQEKVAPLGQLAGSPLTSTHETSPPGIGPRAGSVHPSEMEKRMYEIDRIGRLAPAPTVRSEEHTSELQSRFD